MDSTDQTLPPSAHLALLHKQTAIEAGDEPHPSESFVSSLIAADYQNPIGKPESDQPVKNGTKLDLLSQDAFPSLSPVSPRTPVVSGWSKSPNVNVSAGAENAAKMSPVVTKKFSNESSEVLVMEAKELMANQVPKPLGFKSNAEVIDQVKKGTKTNIMVSTNRHGTVTFLIQGQRADVERAKRELYLGLVVKSTIEVAIPSMMRRFIVGHKGKTLQQIESGTDTRITIPTRKESEEELGPDSVVSVRVTGHKEGVEQARVEIERIVSENAIKETLQTDAMDCDFLQLLTRPFNPVITNLEMSLNVKIQLPPIERRQGVVAIVGERDHAQQAVTLLKDAYDSLQTGGVRQATISVPKAKHKYLAGKHQELFKEILDKTDCILRIPEETDASENVAVYGPDSGVIEGLKIVLEKSNAMYIKQLAVSDLFKNVQNPVAHARAVIAYMDRKGELKKMEESQDVMIGRHGSAETPSLECVSKSVINTEAAYAACEQLCTTQTADRYHLIDLDVRLFDIITTTDPKQLQLLKKSHSVEIVRCDDTTSSAIAIVHEGESVDQQSLDEAADKVRKMADRIDFACKKIPVETQYHADIRGPSGTTLNAVLGESTTAKAVFEDDVITVHGLASDVNRVEQTLTSVHKAMKEGTWVESFRSELTVPATYLPHVIGKSGSHLAKLKKELGVKITMDPPFKRFNEDSSKEPVKVVLQGIQTNVEAAEQRLKMVVTDLADQVTLTLNVPKKYHRSMIGPDGCYVHRLEAKYNVYIKFPKANSTEKDDAITIRGRKKEAGQAKAELDELYKYEKEEQAKRDARAAERKEREAKRKERQRRQREKSNTSSSTSSNA